MAFALFAVAGCVVQPTAIGPTEAVARLRTGESLLTCRDEACLAAWQRAQPQAAALAAAGSWADLAGLVLGVNYQDDLTLFYLGQAAEGLGYPGAAASFYRQSAYLSRTALSCRYTSRLCGGLDLPEVAYRRLAAIDRSLRPRRARRAAPAPHGHEAPARAGEAVSEPAAVETAPSAAPQPSVAFPPEPPAPAPEPQVATPPKPAPAQHPASAHAPTADFIEPPPARR
ncbi:MAG: hypothetical protein ACM3JG_01765 [Thiohalocapsa sp.]